MHSSLLHTCRMVRIYLWRHASISSYNPHKCEQENPRNPLTSRCVTSFLPVKFTTCLPISHHIGVWLILSDWGERTDINHLHKSCLASHTMAWQPKHCVTQTDDKRDGQRESGMNQLHFRQFKCLSHSRFMEVWEFNSDYGIILHKISYKHSQSSEDEANWLIVYTLTSSSMPVQAYHFSFLGRDVSTTIGWTDIGLTFGFHGAQKINANDFCDHLTWDHLEFYSVG